MIFCNSCHTLHERDDTAFCPTCQRETCASCQCLDEQGEFYLCQACADLVARRSD